MVILYNLMFVFWIKKTNISLKKMAKYCKMLINCLCRIFGVITSYSGGKTMRLSFIVPVYNVEKYLRQCVDSILSQTFDDYEIILVDDASPDSCPAICDEYAEKYPDTVKVIHQENKGPASARNAGLKNAKGEYVYFADSDDYFVKDGIANICELADSLNADILNMSYYEMLDGKNELKKNPTIFETGKVFEHKELQKLVCTSNTERTVIFAWRNLYRREFLLNENVYFADDMRMLEDPPFNTLAFLKAKRLACVDKPIYVYRIRQDSLQRKNYVENYDRILEHQWDLKIRYFKEYGNGSSLFYKDIADFTIRNMLPVLLSNIYHSDAGDKYAVLRRIGDSEMMRKSFEDYDINAFKSKSLDWWMTLFVKKRWYLPAHFLCKRVLYKNK